MCPISNNKYCYKLITYVVYVVQVFCNSYHILGMVWIVYSTLASPPTPATSTCTTGIRAVLDPMPGAATSEALTVAAHLHYLNKNKQIPG